MNLKQRHIYMLMRKERKIRLKEISEAIGISQAAISQYENGKMDLKRENLEAYRQYIETHDNRK
ncbi:helix-turn-helix transcriptional regulator [Anoxybacillus flavithermus]|uniref:helix-turn-helix domain-containing protein n=1 Tax=Anoxybacillus flavithermus TaxID=33934 RepID=UPI001868F341|nr:helix-turn-helix transcriptional regulator [Anoxybacillus flavithermus]MBE2933238.1 helix-turn-helix transcriptional regulator [Anoxybacillus flavithermus]